ncbi:MAG: hypothetical protein ACR2RB_06395 [Gammaproteobacteria bacterium]
MASPSHDIVWECGRYMLARLGEQRSPPGNRNGRQALKKVFGTQQGSVKLEANIRPTDRMLRGALGQAAQAPNLESDCSRCGAVLAENDAPLVLSDEHGNTWRYCTRCREDVIDIDHWLTSLLRHQ